MAFKIPLLCRLFGHKNDEPSLYVPAYCQRCYTVANDNYTINEWYRLEAMRELEAIENAEQNDQ